MDDRDKTLSNTTIFLICAFTNKEVILFQNVLKIKFKLKSRL